MEPQDVPAVSSTASAEGTVNPQGSDRPVENAVAEFNRKFGKMQEQVNTILTYIASQAPQQQTPAQPPPQGQGEPTDEELWALAQQGNRQAFELYQQRIADRQVNARMTAQTQANIVDAQLRTILARYPVLNDPSHALTQTANAAYQLFLQHGYPANRGTMLEAVKTAIADRPDLIAELHSQGAVARDTVRRSATQVAQAGQTGNMPRQGVVTPEPLKVREGEEAIARRMGIKDPLKSKERFLARQKSGQSSLGAVQAFVNEGEF